MPKSLIKLLILTLFLSISLNGQNFNNHNLNETELNTFYPIKRICCFKNYFKKNIYMKTGIPYGQGLGLEIFPKSKNYLNSFYFDFSNLDLFGFDNLILNEIGDKNNSELNFSQFEVGYNRAFNIFSNFYTSLSLNFWSFKSQILNPTIVSFDGKIDLNFNSIHPMIKIGYKAGNKFFLKSEIGVGYFFPKIIQSTGDFESGGVLINSEINIYPHNTNIPIFFKRGFFVFNLIYGIGFQKSPKK